MVAERVVNVIEEKAYNALCYVTGSLYELLHPRNGVNTQLSSEPKYLFPEDIEQMREEVAKLRLPKKPTGLQRLLRYFR